LLQHLVSPELAEYLFGAEAPTLLGFGISPELLAQADASDPEHGLWEMTGLSADFAPILLLGEADIFELGGTPDNVLAHELGHCLGLPHTGEAGNLMTPGQNADCHEPLSVAQIAIIREQLLHEHAAANGSMKGTAKTLEWIPQLVAATLDAHRLRSATMHGQRSSSAQQL
jgi:hypothetical protein